MTLGGRKFDFYALSTWTSWEMTASSGVFIFISGRQKTMATRGEKGGNKKRRVARAYIGRPLDSDKTFGSIESEIARSTEYKGPSRTCVDRKSVV